MALVKRQSNSTRLFIVSGVILAIGVVGYFLSRSYFSSSGATNTTTGPAGRQVITNYGEAILNDSRYTDLQTYGTNLNVDVNTESGQPQPFQ